MKSQSDAINPSAKPSGTGCAECLATGSWWFHLRRCAECGHIGCCDSSPNQHASKHFAETGHPVIRSFEPGERWFFDCRTQDLFSGPTLAAPEAHPIVTPFQDLRAGSHPTGKTCFPNKLIVCLQRKTLTLVDG
jgi:hypothetical protein